MALLVYTKAPVDTGRSALSFLQRTIADRWQFVNTAMSRETGTIGSIVYIGIPSIPLKSFIRNSL
jgi:hypothetical protein